MQSAGGEKPHDLNREGMDGKEGSEAEEQFLILFSPKKLQDTGRCHSPGCWERGHCNLSSTRDFGCSNTLH